MGAKSRTRISNEGRLNMFMGAAIARWNVIALIVHESKFNYLSGATQSGEGRTIEALATGELEVFAEAYLTFYGRLIGRDSALKEIG